MSINLKQEYLQHDYVWPPVLMRLLEHRARWYLANRMRTWDESLYLHAVNTAAYSYYAGNYLGIKGDYLNNLVLGAFFHDFAKADWPRCLLCKELDKPDLITVHAHPTVGAQKVMEEWLDVPDVVVRIIREHHERADGSGYPNGYKKKDIHPLSLIVSAIEVYVALQEPRGYRKRSYTREEALVEVNRYYSNEIVGVLSLMSTIPLNGLNR